MTDAEKRKELAEKEVQVQEFLDEYRSALEGLKRLKAELGDEETTDQKPDSEGLTNAL